MSVQTLRAILALSLLALAYGGLWAVYTGLAWTEPQRLVVACLGAMLGYVVDVAQRCA